MQVFKEIRVTLKQFRIIALALFDERGFYPHDSGLREHYVRFLWTRVHHNRDIETAFGDIMQKILVMQN